MNSYVISAWLVLLATTACLQNVNCENLTPLMSAILNNNVDLVKRLLANGANAKATYYGKSALMMTVEYGDNKMVEILLPKSDANASNKDGDTALDLAKARGSNQIVRLL